MSTEQESGHCLLIAMPQLGDPNFSRTTSLLSTFNKEGAMGFVLNRALDLTLDRVLGEEEKVPEAASSIGVYWGGPVQNNLGWVIHENDGLAGESMVIEGGLYVTASITALKELVASLATPGSPRFRFFLGYSGWGAGQLEQEIAASSWVTAPLNRDLIFSKLPDKTWERSLASIGVHPASLASQPSGEAH